MAKFIILTWPKSPGTSGEVLHKCTVETNFFPYAVCWSWEEIR